MLRLHGGPQTTCLFEITTSVTNLTSHWSVCHFIVHFYWSVRFHKSLWSHCRWSSQIFNCENFFAGYLWSHDPDSGRLTLQHRSTILEPRRKILSRLSQWLSLSRSVEKNVTTVSRTRWTVHQDLKKSSFDADNKYVKKKKTFSVNRNMFFHLFHLFSKILIILAKESWKLFFFLNTTKSGHLTCWQLRWWHYSINQSAFTDIAFICTVTQMTRAEVLLSNGCFTCQKRGIFL